MRRPARSGGLGRAAVIGGSRGHRATVIGGSRGHRATVIGGSLTGLLATRVLADHFDEVVLLERDRLDDGIAPRKGVPQARHVHVLLKQGERILAHSLPGICEELLRAGSFRVDMAGDTKWRHFGGWKTRFASGMTMLSQSRAFLEAEVRGRVAALPGVRIASGRSVIGLVGDRARVRGVRLAAAGDEGTDDTGTDGAATSDRGATTEDLESDLVVDASGRGSRTPQWLADLGASPPEETEVRVDVGYASRLFTRPSHSPSDWLGLMIYPTPPGTRLGVLFPVEEGRWLVTLVGWFGDHPGATDAEFLDFARSLDAPDLHDAIRDAEPASPIAIHKFPSNRRRHYERLRDLPEGLVVLGDAFCSFNPIYGQGMTTGAIGARALDACLRARRGADEPLHGLGRSFHRALAREIASPWMMTTIEDFRSRSAEGARPAWAPLLHWYTRRVHELTWSDAFVAGRFLEVMHLVSGPSALFHPYVVWRALGLPAPQPSPARRTAGEPAPLRGDA